MLKNFAVLAAFLVFVNACKDDNGGPPTRASVQVNGMAAMGMVKSGTIKVYDYSKCSKGAILASAELKDSPLFQFTLVPKESEQPVLFEFSNFSYQEEYSNTIVTVPTERVLSSAAVLKSGENKNITISFWSNLAYARTVYQCTKVSSNAVAHINKSNEVLSKALTFDVSVDHPVPVDKELATFDNLPAVRYGVANAAIAAYTEEFDVRVNGATAIPHTQYNSSLLAEIAFLDLSFDSFLNGTAQSGELKFGNVALDTEQYRTAIPYNMQLVIHFFTSKSGLDKSFIVGVANTLHNSESDIFSKSAALPLNVEDSTGPVYKGKSVVGCEIRAVGNTGGETVYFVKIDVEFDVVDIRSTYVVTVGDGNSIMANPTVYWNSGLKPIVSMTNPESFGGIEPRSVTFTNRFGKQLILNTSANNSCGLTS